MADHRKSFRRRRLSFDGRLFWRGPILLAALAVLGGLLPASAQDAGLKNGAASLSAGKYDVAVRQLSATVNSDTVSPGEAAKALYLRGVAYRKLGQPAKAIADIGAAIWLGLPPSDRVRALVNRGLAFQAAGLNSQAQAELAQARKASSSSDVERLIAEDGGASAGTAAIAAFSTEVQANEQYAAAESSAASPARAEPLPNFDTTISEAQAAPAPAEPPPTRTANASPQWSTAASSDDRLPPAPKPSGAWDTSVANESGSQGSSSRVARWWGSVTDTFSSSSEQEAASSAPAPPPSAPPAEPRPKMAAAPPAPSSWTTKTEVQETASDAGGGSTRLGRWLSSTSDSEPAAPPAAAGGAYRLQLATSRSEAEAKALWQQVSRQNRELASAQPQIEKVDIGNFGTFYSLKIGPFSDKAESLKLCNALKRSGVDCSLVTPEAQ